jgi:hypothetical protein
MRQVALVLGFSAAFTASQAMAQNEAPADEVQQAPAEAAPPEAAPPPAGPAAAPSVLVEPKLAKPVATVENKTSDLEKVQADNKAILDKLQKLKVAGFIQGRYEWHKDAVNGWDYTAKPTTTTPPGNAGSGTKNTFYVRRARLDTKYSGTNAEYVLQLDAGGDTVAARDVEAAFLDTWTPLHLRISAGQFKYPFGHELQQADPAREMPERTRMIQKFFPGERDRGLKIQGSYQMMRFQVALVNGNGIQDPIFKGGKDENTWLDLVGRIGADLGFISGGLSGYYGANDVYNPSYDATTNPDTNPLNLKRYSRVRVGGDVQGTIEVPNVGSLSLRGEIIYSRDKNKGYNGVDADACQDRIGLGWSLIAAQHVGPMFGAVVRVDSYDPLLQGSLNSTDCAGTTAKPGTYVTAGMDRVITYGGGALVDVSPNFRLTLVYEHPTEQSGKKINNDIFTAQLMAKF